jgi:hypothetical protein
MAWREANQQMSLLISFFVSSSLSSCMLVTLDEKASTVQSEAPFLSRSLGTCIISAKRHFDAYIVR